MPTKPLMYYHRIFIYECPQCNQLLGHFDSKKFPLPHSSITSINEDLDYVVWDTFDTQVKWLAAEMCIPLPTHCYACTDHQRLLAQLKK